MKSHLSTFAKNLQLVWLNGTSLVAKFVLVTKNLLKAPLSQTNLGILGKRCEVNPSAFLKNLRLVWLRGASSRFFKWANFAMNENTLPFKATFFQGLDLKGRHATEKHSSFQLSISVYRLSKPFLETLPRTFCLQTHRMSLLPIC